MNAILYVAATGCQWRALPACYPHWNTGTGYRAVVGIALSAFAFGYLQFVGPASLQGDKSEVRADMVIDLADARPRAC